LERFAQGGGEEVNWSETWHVGNIGKEQKRRGVTHKKVKGEHESKNYKLSQRRIGEASETEETCRHLGTEVRHAEKKFRGRGERQVQLF